MADIRYKEVKKKKPLETSQNCKKVSDFFIKTNEIKKTKENVAESGNNNLLETESDIETLNLNISRASLTENKASKAVSSVSCADVNSSFDSTCTFVINQPITDFPSKMC
jgi:hypothetical protein